MTDSSDKEQDFDPTETVEEGSSEDEKFLNRKTGSHAPQALVYTITVAFIGIGFVIGFALVGGFVTSGLCTFQLISQFSQNPTGLAETDSVQAFAKSKFMTCATTSLITPIPLIAGVVGGAIGSYPAYKMAKSIASGKYLRSLV